jgi:nicotinamide mononucleotide adenylyltransferase
MAPGERERGVNNNGVCCSSSIRTDKLVRLTTTSFQEKEKGKKKGVVLLACGSFNPPHRVHTGMLTLAKEALEETGDCVVLGAYLSPVSSLYEKKGLVDVKHRLAMCELACEGSDFVMVDRWEAEQPVWSRTFDVLESVKERTKEVVGGGGESADAPRVVIVCGSDLIQSFKIPGLWSEEHMTSLVVEHGIACIDRPGTNAETVLESIPFLQEKKSTWNVSFIENDTLSDLSSTKLREALKAGEPIDEFTLPSVAEYIRKHSLYSK